ncbi:MAG: glycosyltransferase family 39 protein, partial [Hyphomicrobium sp.]
MTAGPTPAATAMEGRLPGPASDHDARSGGQLYGDPRDHGLRLVLGLVAAYAAIHIGFRLLASWSLGEDDPLENIHVQQLRALYEPWQPPLYDWVLYLVQRFTGPNILSFLAIKYAALIATGGALYAIARKAIGPGITALLAVESLALIYQLSWRYHEGYTHQVGAMFAVAATMWATLRALESDKPRDVLWLGLIAGLGVLTQPVFLVFLVALAVAVAVEPDARARLFAPRLVLAALPVAACLGFYVLQSLAARPAMSASLPAAFAAMLPDWRHALGGFVNAARAPLFYLSPLILIVPLFFPGFVQRAVQDLTGIAGLSRRRLGDDPSEPGQFERIVLRTSVVGFGISLVGASLLGLKGYASHVFMPLYLTSVVWIMGVVRRTGPTPLSLTRFGRLALAIAIFALLARLANMFVLDPVCKICRWGIPYAGLAEELTRAGADRGVIVAYDHEIGGNLRALLPRAIVTLPHGGAAQPVKPASDRSRKVVVWRATDAPPFAGKASSPYLLPGEALGDVTLVRVPWRHLWRPDGYRHSEWKY